MKRIMILALAASVAACATGPSPQLVNGRYYMMGDAGCARYTIMSSTRIMCYDKNGAKQGWKDAIPNETMQVYVQQQAVAAQIMAQPRRSSDTLRSITSDTIARNNSWTPPAVAPIGPQQSQTRCLVNGIYVSCTTRSN